jgi:hypothetical protein
MGAAGADKESAASGHRSVGVVEVSRRGAKRVGERRATPGSAPPRSRVARGAERRGSRRRRRPPHRGADRNGAQALRSAAVRRSGRRAASPACGEESVRLVEAPPGEAEAGATSTDSGSCGAAPLAEQPKDLAAADGERSAVDRPRRRRAVGVVSAGGEP